MPRTALLALACALGALAQPIGSTGFYLAKPNLDGYLSGGGAAPSGTPLFGFHLRRHPEGGLARLWRLEGYRYRWTDSRASHDGEAIPRRAEGTLALLGCDFQAYLGGTQGRGPYLGWGFCAAYHSGELVTFYQPLTSRENRSGLYPGFNLSLGWVLGKVDLSLRGSTFGNGSDVQNHSLGLSSLVGFGAAYHF